MARQNLAAGELALFAEQAKVIVGGWVARGRQRSTLQTGAMPAKDQRVETPRIQRCFELQVHTLNVVLLSPGEQGKARFHPQIPTTPVGRGDCPQKKFNRPVPKLVKQILINQLQQI